MELGRYERGDVVGGHQEACVHGFFVFGGDGRYCVGCRGVYAVIRTKTK